MEAKAEFLQWLLKRRGKDYPFVTYRGGAMKAEVNFQIPLDEIAEHFEVDKITIDGKVWERTK